MFSEIFLGKCEYRCEGNACLVIGVKTLEQEPKVIRLVKEDVSSEIYTKSRVLQERWVDHISALKNVLQPLLGNTIVDLPFVVHLSKDDIEIINKSVENCRPSHRCNKVVRKCDTYALVFPDYCSLPKRFSCYPTKGPVISIEIKPKRGFFGSAGFYPCQKQEPPLCRYCMLQYYKLQRRTVSERSGYCPLDLFSGCPTQMQRALQSLFHSPQNNFRIFKDGKLVYSVEKKHELNHILKDFCPTDKNESSLTSDLIELLIKSLLKNCVKSHVQWPSNSFKQKQCANSSSSCSSSGSVCEHELPKGCILYQIRKLQVLDNLHVGELYSFFLETKKVNQKSGHKKTIGILPRCQLPLYIGQEKQALEESYTHFVSRKVWEFLLAFTMKDCSLMITFKALEDDFIIDESSDVSEHVIYDKDGRALLFSMAVIDLDMKTIDKVKDAYSVNSNIAESYLRAEKAS